MWSRRPLCSSVWAKGRWRCHPSPTRLAAMCFLCFRQDAAALHGLPGYAAVTEDELATWRANSRVRLARRCTTMVQEAEW